MTSSGPLVIESGATYGRVIRYRLDAQRIVALMTVSRPESEKLCLR